MKVEIIKGIVFPTMNQNIIVSMPLSNNRFYLEKDANRLKLNLKFY